MNHQLPWQVLLIGGASGVGKTRVSYPLARHYGVGITEVDDFQAILERMTTPEQQPVLHYWRTHMEEALAMNDEQKLAFIIRLSQTLTPALEAVIANHLGGGAPVVLEGDFLLPALATQSTYGDTAADGQVRAIFLYEEDEAQLCRNFVDREGEEQPERARASYRYGQWLRQEAERLGVPTLPARPWETVLARAIAAIG